MRLVLMLTVVLLSGCASFDELDFSKPLIPVPENKKDVQTKREKVWVETKTSRVWVNSRVDEGGDYVEGHYKHTVLEPGHWVVQSDENR